MRVRSALFKIFLACIFVLTALIGWNSMGFMKDINPTKKVESLDNKTQDDKLYRGPLLTQRALRVVDALFLIEDMEEPRPLTNFTLQPNIVFNSSQARWTVINFLKSSATNIDRRKVIRETWGSMKYSHGGRIINIFIVGIPKEPATQIQIENEHKQFGDILQIKLIDGPEHVPEKTLAGMQWASNSLPSSWLYSSADDDIALHVPNFANYIDTSITDYAVKHPFDDEITEKLPIMCVYSYIQKDPPARNPKSKWYMSKDKYGPDFWPPYCRGGWYTIPVSTTGKLYKVSRWMRYLHLDDVWITGLMRVKLLASVHALSDESLMDAMIVAAPLAKRSENELRNNLLEGDLSKVILSHLWGNIDTIKVDVSQKLREKWDLWKASFNPPMP